MVSVDSLNALDVTPHKGFCRGGRIKTKKIKDRETELKERNNK